MAVEWEILLGPPGTGKTTALLSIVDEELASGTDPKKIGYVSFTRRAAQEAISRASEKFGVQAADLPYFRTIHSLCFRHLGLSRSDVFDGGSVMRDFSEYCGVEVTGAVMMEEGSTFGYTPGDRAMFMENLARVRGVSLRQQFNESDDGLNWAQVDYLSRSLEKFKASRGLIDYTDMLTMFVKQDFVPELDVLVVDEGQDLSEKQWQVVERLAEHCRRVAVAGDDDQAIYRWAGADVDKFIDLRGRVRVLDKSWRVPAEVQSIASGVLSTVSRRREKEWRPREGEGTISRIHSVNDADIMSGDVLILLRNAFLLRQIRSDLESKGIIYEFRGHTSVKKSVIDSILCWERLRKGQPIEVSQARQMYELISSGTGIKRGFKTLPGFPEDALVGMGDLIERGGLVREPQIWHEMLDRIPLRDRTYMIAALKRGESLVKRPRVRVSTIHGAKGGEADHVVLVRDMASRTYEEMHHSPDDEARVWYVAVTRTRHHLSVVEPVSRRNFQL